MINSSSDQRPALDEALDARESESTFILLVGLPCCGKSTYVKRNIDTSVFTIISTDEFVEQEVDRLKQKGDLDATYRSVWDAYHPQAQTLFSQALERAFEQQENIIIDKTNLTRKGRKTLIDMAAKNNYIVEAVVFRAPPPELHKDLLDKRGARTGKIISQTVIDALHAKYQEPTYEEGISSIKNVFMFDDLMDERLPEDSTHGIEVECDAGLIPEEEGHPIEPIAASGTERLPEAPVSPTVAPMFQRIESAEARIPMAAAKIDDSDREDSDHHFDRYSTELVHARLDSIASQKAPKPDLEKMPGPLGKEEESNDPTKRKEVAGEATRTALAMVLSSAGIAKTQALSALPSAVETKTEGEEERSSAVKRSTRPRLCI